ncbi:MAG: amidohydrolase family protein [Firmicutes bacterium]|nr:amidohydrolase family protein [Bacillota bacterium]
MKVYKGAILTCDAQDHVYQYLVEDRGHIAYVGDDLPEEYAEVPVIELGNRALIPAFGDSHIHFASFATFNAGLNVANAKSNAEILDMIREFVPKCKDKLLIAFGASNHSVAEKKFVTRKELDSVCPDKPLFMVKYDGHTCVVNTKLLDILKDKVKDLRGYHEDTGEMNQEAFFKFSDYVSSSVPPVKLIRNMQIAADHLASRGIGMIHSVSGVGYTMDLDVDMEHWFSKGLDNGLQMRVYFQTMDVKKAKRRKMVRIGGCFESALDGCFGSADAAMLEPYEGTDDKGILYYSDEQVTEFCKKANREGMQIEIHAIGDAAFAQATRALKAALDDCPRKDHRHTIIHACLPTEEGIQICADYEIALAIQSCFIDWPNEPQEYLEGLLGGRADQLNPFKTYADRGIVQALGSDGPCTEPDPISWIHKACNNGAQSLTVQQALKMCTYNTYWMSFDETMRGSLELGKYADMVILSENPYEVDVTKLDQIQVEQLLLQGQPYQKISKYPVGQVVKGMFK